MRQDLQHLNVFHAALFAQGFWSSYVVADCKGNDLTFSGMGPPFGRTGRKESKLRVRALEKLIGRL